MSGWVEQAEHDKAAHDYDLSAYEAINAKLEREIVVLKSAIARYAAHETACQANDLDPLDRAPCTCGLRRLIDPLGLALSRNSTPEGEGSASLVAGNLGSIADD